MKPIPFKTPAFGYFPRPAFTDQVGKRMVEFGTNLALFAPRRRGKTTWALLELQPAAAAWKVEFAYINLWSDRSDPVGVLAKGLEIAAGIRVDDGSTREIEGSVSAGLFGVKARKVFPKVTTEITDRLKAAMAALAARERRTLLVIDEFQAISEADTAGVAIGAFRTALESHGDKVVALFTGSERSTLAKMFRAQTDPLLDQAKLIELPELEEDFAKDRAIALKERTGIELSEKDVFRAFVALGKSPLLLNEALTEMAVHANLTLDAAVAELIETRGAADYGVQVASLPDMDRALLTRIASGKKPYTDLDELPWKPETPEKRRVPTAQAAIKRLRQKGLIEERLHHKTGWIIPDPLLQKWILRLANLRAPLRDPT
jgi:hypothetical protein